MASGCHSAGTHVHWPEDRGTGRENAGLALRGVDPLALAGALAVIDRAELGQRVTVGAHPVEIGIAETSRHRRLRQTRHLALPTERRRDSPTVSVPPSVW